MSERRKLEAAIGLTEQQKRFIGGDAPRASQDSVWGIFQSGISTGSTFRGHSGTDHDPTAAADSAFAAAGNPAAATGRPDAGDSSGNLRSRHQSVAAGAGLLGGVIVFESPVPQRRCFNRR